MGVSVSPTTFSVAPRAVPDWQQADHAFIPDTRVNRRVLYKMYPSKAQDAGLWNKLRLHQQLYNGALEERIGAWQKCRRTISAFDQNLSLKAIREVVPEYLTLNFTSCQQTLRRLDKAFAAFFKRAKVGQTPGFPRFKSTDRFPGWSYIVGDGFKFEPGLNWKHGRVRLEDLGWVKLRGEARTPGQVVCCDVLHKADGWYLSVCLLCAPHREVDEDRVAASFDWGVETYLTFCVEDREGAFHAGDMDAATIEVVPNPRIGRGTRDAVAEAQRKVARRKRGSQGHKRAKKALARAKRKETNRRKDWREQITAKMVRRFHTIVSEELNVSGMTRSAKGSVEEPGKNVAQKAGLNREILDTAPSETIARFKCKAEEAGTLYVELNTRQEAPSQHCVCGSRRRKALSDRIHVCEECGRTEGRDAMSARYMLARLFGHVQPPKVSAKVKSLRTRAGTVQAANDCETPSRVAA